MVYKRIIETLQNIICKFLQFIFRQVQSFHQLVKHHLMDIFSNYFMLASVTNNIHTGQISNRRKNGMRPIQQSNLTFMVWSFRRYKQYVQACLVSREFFGNLLRSLNNPQMEDFSLDHQVIVILQFFFDSCNILAGESRNYTVYQRSIYTTGFFKPSLKFFAQIPQLNVLIDRFFQFVTIQENKFAREDNQAFCLVAIECLKTMI